MADKDRWWINKIEEVRAKWHKEDEKLLRQNEERQRQRQIKDEKKRRQYEKRQSKLEAKRQRRAIEETEHYDSEVINCEEVLYGIASIYCEDPYLTEEVYRVADPSAGQFKYYRHENPEEPVNIVRYEKENMIQGDHKPKSKKVTEVHENSPKNKRQYIKKYEEYDKKEMEISFLKNRNAEDKKEIDWLNSELADNLSLVDRLKAALFNKDKEIAEHTDTVNELQSTVRSVQNRLKELEKEDVENKLKIEETEAESIEVRMKIAERESQLVEKEELLGKVERELKDKVELLDKLKSDHKTKVDEKEVELLSLKMKIDSMERDFPRLLEILKVKEGILAEMEINVNKANQHITELKKSGVEKDEILEKLQREIKEKERKNIERERNLMITHDNLSKSLADKDDLLEELKREHKIKMNESEVKSMNMKMKSTEMDEVYSNLIKIFKGKDEKLAEMEINLIIANQNITGLNRTLDDNDELMEKLQRELKEREIENKNIKERLTQKEEVNKQLTLKVERNKEDITELWRIITDKEEKMADLSLRLTGKDMTAMVQRRCKTHHSIVEKPYENENKELIEKEEIVDKGRQVDIEKISDPDSKDEVKPSEGKKSTQECNATKERKTELTTERVEKSKLTKKYDNDMCSAGHSLESGDTEYGCDIQTHSTVNVAQLRKDIDTLRSRRAGNTQTMTDKSSQDRLTKKDNGFAGPLRVMFLLIAEVLGRTVSRGGESGACADVVIDTRGQEGKFKGQGYYDTSCGIVIPTWEVPRRHDLEHISLYNGNQGRLLFRIGDKRNIPPSDTTAMIFFNVMKFLACVLIYMNMIFVMMMMWFCVNYDKC